MNQSEMIDQVAKSADLCGLGALYWARRAARSGRHRRTGESVMIKAAKLPKFRAGKGLKDAVN